MDARHQRRSSCRDESGHLVRYSGWGAVCASRISPVPGRPTVRGGRGSRSGRRPGWIPVPRPTADRATTTSTPAPGAAPTAAAPLPPPSPPAPLPPPPAAPPLLPLRRPAPLPRARRPRASPLRRRPGRPHPFDRPRTRAGYAPRGAAARIASNMTASLGVPTATSFRVVPARLLEVNRKILNNQLSRTGSAGKVSFTHIIGYALVQALKSVPVAQLHVCGRTRGRPQNPPAVIHHEHVALGIAVDLEKSDGSRTLMVPVIRDADELDFRSFWSAYEDLIRRVRSGKIGADDLAGATVTLTNPGTIGTVQSVPRLMPGQGAIIGVGSIDYPAEWQAADPRVLAELGVSKVVTITSTYDHRIIQGAESGLFLQRMHRLLVGEESFYQMVFKAMGVPYEPVRFHRDVNDLSESSSIHTQKQIDVDNLINMYRVRGHLIAHLDPLDWKDPHMHPELDPTTHGLSVWDLDREFLTNGLAGSRRMSLGDILGILRDAYCRTVGVEYMYIQEPDQKRWIQEHVEGVHSAVA